jgi:hypothetical protein
LGVVLWAITWLINRQLGIKETRISDIEHLTSGPD